MVKIGICAAACAVILGMKALNTPTTAQVVSGVRTAINEETDIDKMLGKLQFVELPNALEVFSNDSKMVVPVNATKAYVEPERNTHLGGPPTQVMASARASARIGEDSILGKYVRLSHSGDLETSYYGLATIQVEQGQPIRRLVTLGTRGEDGTLRLSVLLAGEPQSPDTYWDLVHEG
jgi:murein DD-endopeptidase MepM/ murein hydrolase activator NlpD